MKMNFNKNLSVCTKITVQRLIAMLLVITVSIACCAVTDVSAKKKKRKQKPKEYEMESCLLENPSSILLGNNITVYKTKLYTNAELKYLACIIQAEAGNQPYKGKVAVGNVVMNRVYSSAFPNTIKEVIYQGNGMQFSPVGNGSYSRFLREYSKNGAQIRECKKAAKDALLGRKNYVGDYLYFRTVASMTPELKAKNANCHKIIGDHYFHATY